MPGLLDTITGIFKGKNPLDSLGDLVDRFITSPDEKKKFLAEAEARLTARDERIRADSLAVFQAEIESVKGAQEMNIKIQGDRPSWMARNVAYLIDVFVIVLWGAITTYLLASMLNIIQKVGGVDYTGVTAIWGGVTALATQIIGFHRGSSQGSADKQKLLDKMTSVQIRDK